MEPYIAATGEANEGMCDSINQYYFRTGDETFITYAAFDGKKIVGGILSDAVGTAIKQTQTDCAENTLCLCQNFFT